MFSTNKFKKTVQFNKVFLKPDISKIKFKIKRNISRKLLKLNGKKHTQKTCLYDNKCMISFFMLCRSMFEKNLEGCLGTVAKWVKFVSVIRRAHSQFGRSF